MNKRLLAYLRSLGLDANASDEQAWEFYNGLRGLNASLASALNYNEADHAARTNCDLMIRALGYDPENPQQHLSAQAGQQPGARSAGTDGASLGGNLPNEDRERIVREGQRLEAERRQSIEQFATMAGASDELLRSLISDPQITFDAARQRLWEDHQARTRASVPPDRPTVPTGGAAIHSRASVTGVTQEVLEAAMLHRSGIDPTQRWVRLEGLTPTQRRAPQVEMERAAELAWQFRSLSIEDFFRMAARLDDVTLPMGRDGLLEAYCGQVRSFSTSALSAIFTTNVNSMMLAAYEVAPDSTTGGWVRESDVSDFKTNERARMVNGGALDKLPRGGSANHATFSDVVESYKIARYAKKFEIDDQDIIDDSFGETKGFVPADLGVAARQLRPDLVYAILMANAALADSIALFHASHGNLQTSSALAVGTLSSARAKMRLQTENGRNLNLSGRFVIVPPTVGDTARVLVKDRTLITGSDILIPSQNANADANLQVVEEARLENGLIDPRDGSSISGSNSTWFLSALASAHTIEIGYRRGTGRVPQVRPYMLTEGRWGVGWDVSMDIGGKALGHRGMVKSTG